MNETAFIRSHIRPYLESLGARVFKIHGNVFMETGTPDLLCCIDGTFVGIECKVRGNKPTAIQLAVLDSIRRAGGLAGVVYTDTFEEDIKNILYS